MPLIKSGSKKAFSENVREMMHHGHPQKQALAAAYSNMRKYGHKMSSGGMCEACGGRCKYADGGEVDSSPSPAPSPMPIDPDKAKSVQDSFTHALGFAKGGKISSEVREEAKEEHESPEYEEKEHEELHEGVMHELMDAIHSKDHKGAMSALKALVMSMKE